MIDDIDASTSTLRLLLRDALKTWNLKPILELLFDDDYIVRTAAARELQIRGDHDTYDFAARHIGDESAHVREICSFVLGQLGTPNMPYKSASYPLLLNRLEDPEPDVRMAAASALGHLAFDGMPLNVEDALLRRVTDDDKGVRTCVAYALGNSSGSEAVERALQQLRNDSDESVRCYAELGLELLTDKRTPEQT